MSDATNPFAATQIEPPGRMSTTKIVVGTVLGLLVLAVVAFVVLKKQPQPALALVTPPVQATTTTIKIGFPSRELPDFEFAECLGGTVSRESLRGKRWLANFVFTRCAGPCPVMTRDVSLLHEKVKEKKDRKSVV